MKNGKGVSLVTWALLMARCLRRMGREFLAKGTIEVVGFSTYHGGISTKEVGDEGKREKQEVVVEF
jgi:hypothetical protein